ncbi:MAG: SMI1/KNR4 family protein [Chloroflexota bacterium]
MTETLDLDTLIERLRARAADPERRTSSRPSRLFAAARTMDLGGLLQMGRSLASELGRVVAANQAGRVDEAGYERARELEREMSTPAPMVLPAPAGVASIAAAEAALGVTLPPALRRVYAEVADGGFGPGEGILPLAEVVRAWRELRAPGSMPRGRAWPDGLLPLVEMSPGFDCVDAATGRIVAWDPEELTERSSEERFRRSFRELFPSVEAWLADWVGSKTQAEQQAELMAHVLSDESQIQQAREARAVIGRMTPEERAKMGLPEVGWERVVWGGLGWDEDEAGS